LEGSKLLIEDVPVVIYCEHCCCNRTIQATPNMTCPVCGKLDSQIVSGRELEVVGIEIDDCSQAVAEPAELVQ
jgi:hydrogenase nickel incorporation protein HypA/HybF